MPVFGAGRISALGLDDPDAADAGLDVADELTFSAGSDSDKPTQLEYLPVERRGDLWIRVDKEGKVHAGVKAPRKAGMVARRSTDQSARWMGFSMIGKGRHDVRPDLLALVWQRNLIGVERCIQYGANYLLASGHHRNMDMLQTAAADALLILVYGETRGDGDGDQEVGQWIKCHRPHRPTLHERDRQFKRRNGTLAPLRKAALKVYRRRYREAVALFADADNWRPTPTGRSFARAFAEPAWLPDSTKVELFGPMAQLFHDRHPTVPPTDWISGRGRLTSTDRYNGMQTDSHRHDEFVSRSRSA
ncbi:hypothetical protein B1991_18255 [Rhodanobacter lindaniclasticus]|uniref:Uncharacterized protein n=1 Tax=Rhodanobacter lindaniclasticus TaxID=75310 RepID=A0A4S3K6D3_9GAMM|nr:hypothetical protein B1991_18255 [Rhodanobacter lindaniclasticus]